MVKVYINYEDLKKNYSDTFVVYNGELYFASAEHVGGRGINLTLYPVLPDGTFSTYTTLVDMNKQPEFKPVPLGMFISENKAVFILEKSVRRQWIFGASTKNITAYGISLNRDNEVCEIYEEPGYIREFAKQHTLSQVMSRDYTLDDMLDSTSFVLTSEFAVILDSIVSIDGLVAKINRVRKAIVKVYPDFDDSIIREKLLKFKWNMEC